jgi:hypothetical protein
MEKCELCGSVNVKVIRTRTSTPVPVPFGPDVDLEFESSSCLDCSSEIVLDSDELEDEFEQRLTAAEHESLINILKYLEDEVKVRNNDIERCLRLPQGSISSWLEDGASKEAIVLMRMVRSYPWLLTAADSNFDKESAA